MTYTVISNVSKATYTGTSGPLNEVSCPCEYMRLNDLWSPYLIEINAYMRLTKRGSDLFIITTTTVKLVLIFFPYSFHSRSLQCPSPAPPEPPPQLSWQQQVNARQLTNNNGTPAANHARGEGDIGCGHGDGRGGKWPSLYALFFLLTVLTNALPWCFLVTFRLPLDHQGITHLHSHCTCFIFTQFFATRILQPASMYWIRTGLFTCMTLLTPKSTVPLLCR